MKAVTPLIKLHVMLSAVHVTDEVKAKEYKTFAAKPEAAVGAGALLFATVTALAAPQPAQTVAPPPMLALTHSEQAGSVAAGATAPSPAPSEPPPSAAPSARLAPHGTRPGSSAPAEPAPPASPRTQAP